MGEHEVVLAVANDDANVDVLDMDETNDGAWLALLNDNEEFSMSVEAVVQSATISSFVEELVVVLELDVLQLLLKLLRSPKKDMAADDNIVDMV